jgi:transcriptional regulator with PAS, ATPase and Fis domain
MNDVDFNAEEEVSGFFPVPGTASPAAIHVISDAEIALSAAANESVMNSGASEAQRPHSMLGIVGASNALLEVFSVVDSVADSGCTVLVTGESGTGKELVARAVHEKSSRRSGAFVPINCGAIPEALLESELFGHARGAFTGAHATRKGRIALAEGGTLFLDEIGELPLALQVKLLRVLQQREYSPVGDTKTYKADVRIVAATNVNLEDAVRQGRFREDLYYRLNVIHLDVPALRDRHGDTSLLAEYFLTKVRERTGRVSVSWISAAAMRVLESYSWPGNVRELENAIERAVLLCSHAEIEPSDLPARVCGLAAEKRPLASALPDTGIDLRAAVEAFENNLIKQALDRTKWNKNRAAQLLGLNRTTLVEMLKRKRIEAA